MSDTFVCFVIIIGAIAQLCFNFIVLFAIVRLEKRAGINE